ncbi:MAG: aminoglycoside adenylyltransferase domain-containing protein [Pyrinomonadaceae bacterium]
MGQHEWRDCPDDARKQIERLTENLKIQIGGNLIGIYLHGSLAMNCFNPLHSDVDLLVATRREMKVETKRGVAEFLLENSRQPSPFEISFLSNENLSPWRYPTPFDFHYSEDWREKFERDLADGEWKRWNDVSHYDEDLAAHITVTNQRGVCLYGASAIFPLVPRADFARSILADVESAKFGFDVVLQYSVYVILNSCRTLAFLRTGLILSKDEGGIWALENLSARFRDVITSSLNEYRGGNESDSVKEQLIDFVFFMQNETERAIAESERKI